MIETKYNLGQKVWYLEQDSYWDESDMLYCPNCDFRNSKPITYKDLYEAVNNDT